MNDAGLRMWRALLPILVLLLSVNAHGQTAQFTLPLSIQDGTERVDTIHFGIHPLATTCIDASLGEEEIPFDVCCNWFNILCIRFSDIGYYEPPASCLGNGLRLDLRDYRDPYQIDTFRIEFCGTPPWIVRWPSNLESYVDSARIEDHFGGFIYRIDMLTVDSLLVSNPAVRSLAVIIYGPHIVSGVLSEDVGISRGFTLLQNYPNPFNATTTITFELQHRSHVNLKVTDLLGRNVGVLVDGMVNPGIRSVQFDPVDLGSGVYIYRLVVNGSTIARKFLIQK